MTQEEKDIQNVIQILSDIDKKTHSPSEIRRIHTETIKKLAGVMQKIHELQQTINANTNINIENLNKNIVAIKENLFGSIDKPGGEIYKIQDGIKQIQDANEKKQNNTNQIIVSVVSGAILIAISIFLN